MSGHYAELPMRAVEQWRAIERGLDPAWDEVSLTFVAEDRKALDAAAGVLGSLGAGRHGSTLRFTVSRRGGEPERLVNLLGRLDRKRIWGTLTLAGASVAPSAAPDPAALAAALSEATSLAAAWDDAVADLPPGWSDVLCELELDSTDFVPRAALLGSPLNPARGPGTSLRFRASDGIGYGTSSGMVRRCFERMDAEGISGGVRVLQGVSDVGNVLTQGPIWRISGRSV
jgi:hypothetical protein